MPVAPNSYIVCGFQLIISFESVAEDSQFRKECKYRELMEAGYAVGYRLNLLLEVGSRRMILDSDMSALQFIFGASVRTMKVLS